MLMCAELAYSTVMGNLTGDLFQARNDITTIASYARMGNFNWGPIHVTKLFLISSIHVINFKEASGRFFFYVLEVFENV